MCQKATKKERLQNEQLNRKVANWSKQEAAITLIALVVTIVVLLILAGITITFVLGENGIINMAKRASDATNKEVEKEQEDLKNITDQMQEYLNGSGIGGDSANVTPIYAKLYTDGTLILSSIDYTDTSRTILENYNDISQNKYNFDYNEGKLTGNYPGWLNQTYNDEGKYWEVNNKASNVIIYDKISPTNTSFWFGSVAKSNITSLDLSNLNTSNVTDMTCMFTGCSNLTSLNLSGFNTSNVTDMAWMFSGCSNLTSLNLNNFNTSRVTDMSGMFSGCLNLTSLDLSDFNTSNVNDMREMFYHCYKISDFAFLNSWNVDNVKNFEYMWLGNEGEIYSFSELDISNWNIASDANLYCMFQNGEQEITMYVKNQAIKELIEGEESNGIICIVKE